MNDETIDRNARADLKAHTDICTERYGNLWTAISNLKQTIDTNNTNLKTTIETNNTVTHERFTAISNRMWASLASVCGAAVLGLVGTVFYLITHSLK